jgi:hypothetical protein
MTRTIAVDPWGCGCTECITGEYVPLRRATDDNVADLLAGRIANHLDNGTELDVMVTYRTDSTGRNTVLRVDSVSVRYTHHDGQMQTWTPDPFRAGL